MINLGLIVKATAIGLGKHEQHLDPNDALQTIKWIFIVDPFGIIGVALPKLAVVIFLARIVGPAKRLQIWTLYFLVISLLVLSGVSAILLFAQCSPPSAAWQPTVPHTCWNPKILADYSYFVGGISCFLVAFFRDR